MQENLDIGNRDMTGIQLSYVITTRNKLPYLKEVMRRLLANIQHDEEIVISDGASTDGTVEYLTQLYRQGKIHQFISEPDRGEAHGYNKCLLLARGELVKIITDDDVFYYPAIQECKNYMLEHHEIDVLSGNTAGASLEEPETIRILTECETNYLSWLHSNKTEWFIGLPLMIRRKSLALTGLFFTGVIQVDTEYSLRITSLKTNIAWNTALIAVRLDNPSSNFRRFSQDPRSFEERQQMYFFYDQGYRKSIIELTKDRIKIRNGIIKLAYLLKLSIHKLLSNFSDSRSLEYSSSKVHSGKILVGEADIENAFLICDEFISNYNRTHNSTILSRGAS